MKRGTAWTSPISSNEMKRLCDEAFARAFPEVAAMEAIKKEKGKLSDADLRRIFNIK